MTAPNMETITESLERSFQNCSLNHERRTNHNIGGGNGGAAAAGVESSIRKSSSSTSDNNINNNDDDTSLELNSHLSLPYHWEQCLDLKTGEIYYINWMNGMKAKEDPRTAAAEYNGDFYSDDDDDGDDSLYDSEESQSGTCSRGTGNCNNQKDNVLVVAGCKSCLMYFMVPKQVEDCPKCNGQLLHFDRSETSSP